MNASIERTSRQGPVVLTIRVTPAVPRLSDLVDIEIEVQAPPEFSIKPPVFGQALGDFIVRHYTEKKTKPTPDKNTRTFHYQVEAASAGTHLIRAIAIEYSDPNQGPRPSESPLRIESEPIEVNVTSMLEQGVPDLADLESPVPPMSLGNNYSWLAWTLLPVAMMAAALVWLYRRRTQMPPPVPTRPPSEIAQSALAALLAENLIEAGRFQEFYLRLTGIVRTYIEGTTGVRAPEQTTEEFLRALHCQQLFPPEPSIHLQQFLQAADMVKYAGQQPTPDQISNAIDRAREFISLKSLPPVVATDEVRV